MNNNFNNIPDNSEEIIKKIKEEEEKRRKAIAEMSQKALKNNTELTKNLPNQKLNLDLQNPTEIINKDEIIPNQEELPKSPYVAYQGPALEESVDGLNTGEDQVFQQSSNIESNVNKEDTQQLSNEITEKQDQLSQEQPENETEINQAAFQSEQDFENQQPEGQGSDQESLNAQPKSENVQSNQTFLNTDLEQSQEGKSQLEKISQQVEQPSNYDQNKVENDLSIQNEENLQDISNNQDVTADNVGQNSDDLKPNQSESQQNIEQNEIVQPTLNKDIQNVDSSSSELSVNQNNSIEGILSNPVQNISKGDLGTDGELNFDFPVNNADNSIQKSKNKQEIQQTIEQIPQLEKLKLPDELAQKVAPIPEQLSASSSEQKNNHPLSGQESNLDNSQNIQESKRIESSPIPSAQQPSTIIPKTVDNNSTQKASGVQDENKKQTKPKISGVYSFVFNLILVTFITGIILVLFFCYIDNESRQEQYKNGETCYCKDIRSFVDPLVERVI